MQLESPSAQIAAENGTLTITSLILEAYVLIQRFFIHLLQAK